MDTHIESTEATSKDKGFTLVELLIVIVILGILATVTVFAVRGITDKGQTSACTTDKATIQTATESYFAQYGGSQIASTGATAPPTGAPAASNSAVTAPTGVTAGADAGLTLVNAKFLRTAPTNYFVGIDGTLYVAKVACGTVGASAG